MTENSKLQCKTTITQEICRKMLVSLIFVDTEVKNNLCSNITKAKKGSVYHG